MLLVCNVLLPLYSNMLSLACTVVADHSRFHVIGVRMPLQVSLVVFLHFCFYQLAAGFHERHVTLNSLRKTHPPKKEGYTLGHHGGSRVYSSWILVCVVASEKSLCKTPARKGVLLDPLVSPKLAIATRLLAQRCCMHVHTKVLTALPGIVYSVAKAVPGFLHQVSDLWRWLISNAVALFSGPAH
eukprot:910960-Amphidinium_carterae.2